MNALIRIAAATTLACACGGAPQQPAPTPAVASPAPVAPATSERTSTSAGTGPADRDQDTGTREEPPVQGGVLGGVANDAPPPPPPPPRKPFIVPKVALEQQRLAGVKRIIPDEAVKTAMSRAGQRRLVSTFKMCLSDAGIVESVEVLKSSGHQAYDRQVRSTILGTWRYRPFVVNGVEVPVCTSVTFIFNHSP